MTSAFSWQHSLSLCPASFYTPLRYYGTIIWLGTFQGLLFILFITGDWNAKVGSQEIPGVTGKFGLGVQNEAGQKLIEFCQENTLVIANTIFQQHERRLYAWT